MSHAVARMLRTGHSPQRRPIALAPQWLATGRNRKQPAVRQTGRRVDQPLGRVEVVRGHHDDRARGPKASKALDQQPRRLVIETREWLIEQHETRTMDQRAFERETLPQTSRKSCSPIVGAFLEPGMGERDSDGRIRVADCRTALRRIRDFRARSGPGKGTDRVRGRRFAPASRCPTRARCVRRTQIRPCPARTSVESRPRSVDFPAPFGPKRPRISPARQSIETCAKARRRP